MIKITYLSDCIGAEKFGTCSSCLKGSKEDERMVRIKFYAQNGKHLAGTSVCLCNECRRLLITTLRGRVYAKQDFCEWLDDAPTIVEAEDGT